MVVACAAAAGGALTFILPPVVLALVIARILAEERLLRSAPAYIEYSKRVRYRLVPGVC